MIGCLPTLQALAFLAVFVYATHATQAIAFDWKPGFSRAVSVWTVQVVIVAEMPTAGGFYISRSVHSTRLHPYVESYQLFFLFVQLVFLIFTIVFVLRTLRDLMAMGAQFYSTPRCWIDLGLAASSTFLVAMFICYSVQLYDMSDKVETMHYSSLFYYDQMLLAADGFVGLFAILRALLLFRYFPPTHRLIVVMNKASPYLVASVIFGLIVWLMIASSASAMFGREVLQLRTLDTSLASTIYAMSRVYRYQSLHLSHPLAASLFVMVLVLFFLCIVRAMCAVALIVSFRDISKLPQSQETRLFFRQLAQNFRDAVSCVGINIKKKKKKPAAIII